MPGSGLAVHVIDYDVSERIPVVDHFKSLAPGHALCRAERNRGGILAKDGVQKAGVLSPLR
jgi:hypothetical protein